MGKRTRSADRICPRAPWLRRRDKRPTSERTRSRPAAFRGAHRTECNHRRKPAASSSPSSCRSKRPCRSDKPRRFPRLRPERRPPSPRRTRRAHRLERVAECAALGPRHRTQHPRKPGKRKESAVDDFALTSGRRIGGVALLRLGNFQVHLCALVLGVALDHGFELADRRAVFAGRKQRYTE